MAKNPSTTNQVFEAIRAELKPPEPAAMICLTRAQAQAALAERDCLRKAVAIVLNDKEGDLDFVQFQVRAALSEGR